MEKGSRKMRILYWDQGPKRSNFIEHLKRKKHKVFRVGEELFAPGGKSLWFPLNYRKIRHEVDHLLKNVSPDVVHICGINTIIAYTVVKSAKKRNIKLLASLYSYRLICPKSSYVKVHPLRPCRVIYPNIECLRCCMVDKKALIRSNLPVFGLPLYMTFLRSMYKNVDLLISESKSMAKLLKKIGYANTIQLYSPVDERFLNSNSVKPKNDFVSYIGRLTYNKGVILLPKIAKNFPCMHFHVAGSGPYYQWLKNNKTSNMIVHGFLSREKILKLIEQSNFTIVPSISGDVFPGVVRESFAIGRPVVAFKHTGPKEQIEESGGGVLADPFDIRDLISKVAFLLEKPDKAYKMGQKGKNWVKKEMHPRVFAERLSKIYGMVLK